MLTQRASHDGAQFPYADVRYLYVTVSARAEFVHGTIVGTVQLEAICYLTIYFLTITSPGFASTALASLNSLATRKSWIVRRQSHTVVSRHSSTVYCENLFLGHARNVVHPCVVV